MRVKPGGLERGEERHVMGSGLWVYQTPAASRVKAEVEAYKEEVSQTWFRVVGRLKIDSNGKGTKWVVAWANEGLLGAWCTWGGWVGGCCGGSAGWK
jgi:hypothetical protein